MRPACLFSALVPLALCAGASAQSADVSPFPAVGSPPTPVVSNGAIPGSVLYDNGPFITGIGNGFGGADTSEIQAGGSTFGYNNNAALVPQNFRIADDFDVPSGDTWDLASMTYRAYQTGGSTAGTMTGAFVQIWDGPPGGGGTVIAGDTTTNRLTSQAFSGVYRVTSTTLTNNQRPIIDLNVDMSWAPDLTGGTYWVDVGLTGSLASGPWANPVVPSQPSHNGRQHNAGAWTVVIDTGGGFPQDFPFFLEGISTGGCNPNISTYCTAKISASGCSPSIGSTGTPSGAGSFALTATDVEVNVMGLVVYSLAGPAATPFFGGTLCVQSPNIFRTPASSSGGGMLCEGSFTHDMTSVILTQPPSSQIWAQFWFRDPNDPQGIGLTDAITFTTCP